MRRLESAQMRAPADGHDRRADRLPQPPVLRRSDRPRTAACTAATACRCRSCSSTSTSSRASTTRSATTPATGRLREVAAFLQRKIREADYVFRWGGDEFLLLMSCREDEALRRATGPAGSEFARHRRRATPAERRRPQLRLRRSVPAGGIGERCAQDRRRADVRQQAGGTRDGCQGGVKRRSRLNHATGRADTSPAAAASALRRRPTIAAIAAGSSPARMRVDAVLRSEQPLGGLELVFRAVQLRAAPPRSRRRARTGRSAARSVTIMNTP